MSAGTGYTLMHNWLNRHGLAHRPVPGGVGRISEALVAAFRQRGGELRTSAPVQQIRVDRQRASGVRLAGGEEPRGRARRQAAQAVARQCREQRQQRDQQQRDVACQLHRRLPWLLKFNPLLLTISIGWRRQA